MGQFDDIRPYDNHEVPAVIQSLLADRELIAAIASLKLGVWHKAFTWFIYPVIRSVLRYQLRTVETVADFQLIVRHYMENMIAATTVGLTESGFENLDYDTTYLFMSNHRDITLDPAFISYALDGNKHNTVRIAIGDNLLSKPYVSDLMRLNKSFIVNRSAKGPRQMLASYKQLSSYILHSITVDKASIWIAQRQGRAKNGVDRTETALVKMVAMSQDKKKESFAEYINRLNIVPVAISYEFDPCDKAKARELYEVDVNGAYAKTEHEDVSSIVSGITGKKGHVHVSFGQRLTGEFEGAESVANAIDAQVVKNYRLHPTNFFAYKMLHGKFPPDIIFKNNKPFDGVGFQFQEQAFKERVEAVPTEHRKYMLGIYANAIKSKRQFSI